MNYGSLFSGIGGFDLGFDRAGLTCAWQCEIDKPCRMVLNRHFGWRIYDDVRNLNSENAAKVDILCGGFPCQDVSIAGRRTGLAGERSGLWTEFARVIRELTPRIVIIENVPGLLSSNNGRDFKTIIDQLVEFGYGVCWRIFDAQFFGVAQGRRRVFVVGSLGNGSAAEILFEREGMRWNPPARRTKGKEVARTVARSTSSGYRNEPSEDFVIAGSLHTGQPSRDAGDLSNHHIIAQTLNPGAHAGGFNGQDVNNLIAPYKIVGGKAGGGKGFMQRHDIAFTLHAPDDQRIGVRRLTPTECERLQGFPDGWTAGQSDAARYKQLGNAVAVPVAEWIGKQIVKLDWS